MTKGKRIVVDARLQGMGRDVKCKVAGLRTSSSDAVVFEIRDISILGAPKDLTDGLYELDYQGSGERFMKAGETWEMI